MQAPYGWRGPVRVDVRHGPAPGLRLSGASADGAGELRVDAFHVAGARLEALPAELRSARLAPLEGSGARWRLSADGVVVCEFEAAQVRAHRDLEAAALAVLPPRRVPVRKRLFWWLVLTAARWPFSRRRLLAREPRPR